MSASLPTRETCDSFAEKLTGLFSDIVTETMTVRLLRELDELEITFSQLQALTIVAERKKTSVGAIAEALGVSHVAAVKLVDKLARKELVTRGVAASDHRQSEIRVTPAGLELVHQVRRERTQRLVKVLDQMSPADRQALIQGLESFVTAALRDHSALQALCVSCQALLPTECAEAQLIREDALTAAGATGRDGECCG
ncbi:MAG: MarR family winged helix-turn-helix transcriptional regulator [Armatimonadota bacterium]